MFSFALDLLGMSHLDLLVQELTAVCDKWQYIGEELGVRQSSLRRISTNHSDPGDCLREVLSIGGYQAVPLPGNILLLFSGLLVLEILTWQIT